MSCFFRKLAQTSGPNTYETPLSLSSLKEALLVKISHNVGTYQPILEPQAQGRTKADRIGCLQKMKSSKLTKDSSTCVWNFDGPHDPVDLIQVGELRTQPSVHADDLFIDESQNRKAVEAIGEGFPELNVISSLAC